MNLQTVTTTKRDKAKKISKTPKVLPIVYIEFLSVLIEIESKHGKSSSKKCRIRKEKKSNRLFFLIWLRQDLLLKKLKEIWGNRVKFLKNL